MSLFTFLLEWSLVNCWIFVRFNFSDVEHKLLLIKQAIQYLRFFFLMCEVIISMYLICSFSRNSL